MKLTLNKKALKNLSKDSAILPADMTPQVGGGITQAAGCAGSINETVCNCPTDNWACPTNDNTCQTCICAPSLECGTG